MDKMLVVVFRTQRAFVGRIAKAKGEAKIAFQQRTDKLQRAWERTKARWGATPPAER